jgi:hypothetical protein
MPEYADYDPYEFLGYKRAPIQGYTQASKLEERLDYLPT